MTKHIIEPIKAVDFIEAFPYKILNNDISKACVKMKMFNSAIVIKYLMFNPHIIENVYKDRIKNHENKKF